MYSNDDLNTIGTVRSPIQCQGIERGPKRIAEVGVSGSMNPQISFNDIVGGIGSLAQAAGPILGAFGI